VLELLQNKSTLVQIASKHNILPQNLQNWKKTFLANAYNWNSASIYIQRPSNWYILYRREEGKTSTYNDWLFGLIVVKNDGEQAVWRERVPYYAYYYERLPSLIQCSSVMIVIGTPSSRYCITFSVVRVLGNLLSLW
jgi:hypothetical protein